MEKPRTKTLTLCCDIHHEAIDDPDAAKKQKGIAWEVHRAYEKIGDITRYLSTWGARHATVLSVSYAHIPITSDRLRSYATIVYRVETAQDDEEVIEHLNEYGITDKNGMEMDDRDSIGYFPDSLGVPQRER